MTGEASGVIVLDADGEQGGQSLAGKELPPTRTAKTPHGTHHYFGHPGGKVPNASRLLPGVDLRGDGGYAIAPPSSYENGLYVWLDERDIAPAPQWLLALCRKGGSSPKRTFPEGVAAGQRNTRCTSHVGVWFQAGYADDAVLAMARLWNQSNEPPMDDSEVRGIVESIAERHGDGVEVHLERFDWTHGPVAHKWVVEQLLPEAARCWVIGEPGSGKSLFATAMCVRLAAEGHRVFLFSEENSAVEERRRLTRLGADPDLLSVFHRQGIDLSNRGWQQEVLKLVEADRPVVVVIDSFTSAWGGDENSNAEVAAFDRDLLMPLADLGAAPFVLHHPSRPSEGSNRLGARSGRGASAIGDKADLVYNFRTIDKDRFTVSRGKNRLGLPEMGDLTFQVVDLDDGGLAVEEVKDADAHDPVGEVADRMVAIVNSQGEITTSSLRDRTGSRNLHQQAFERLRQEQPPRVFETEERTSTAGGPQVAKVWRPATSQPQGGQDDQGGWGGQGGYKDPPLMTPPGGEGHRVSFGSPPSELDELLDPPA